MYGYVLQVSLNGHALTMPSFLTSSRMTICSISGAKSSSAIVGEFEETLSPSSGR
jgi:hypothetical protein